MTFDAREQRLRVLVVHHDAVVLEDLCETLAEAAQAIDLHRAESLDPQDLVDKTYDLALIEVSRNQAVFRQDQGTLSAKALPRVVWITDDMHPAPDAPDAPKTTASLRQPFRTEDVMAALHAAGLPPSDKSPPPT